VIKRIYKFIDGTSIAFDAGNFDNWRVSIYRDDNYEGSPREVDFLIHLKTLDADIAWKYVKETYDKISVDLEPTDIKPSIPPDSRLGTIKMFWALAMTMYAEERRVGYILGKRIKLLGIHQLLKENFSPVEVSNWSRGKKWRELNEECKKRGI